MNLKVVDIAIKDGIMPKEFYWNSLQINRLNYILANIKSNEPQTFEMHIPQMPLHSTPLCFTFIVQNTSETDERELKIFKRTSCDCSLKQNRVRKNGRRFKCPHRNIADLRPSNVQIKSNNSIELDMVFRYELLGQHEITFHIVSSHYIVKLKLIAAISEFNPMAMLLTNKLTPVVIDNASYTQQVVWLYNPYSSDIEIKLISYDASLTFPNDVILVKSHVHTAAFVNFLPTYVGCYEMEIGIIFNECECRTKMYAECTSSSACNTNCAWLIHNSPNSHIPSQLNPFVIHGDNLCIVIPQNGISNENLIGLQNNSKHCIKYEWGNFNSLDLPCNISIEPHTGFLKAGFTKLFHIIVKSYGHAVQMHLIPMKCNIYQYDNEVFREYLVPDGYFEYNDRGFYEKPSQWSPKCLELVHTLYINMNIKVLNNNEFSRAISSINEKGDNCDTLMHWICNNTNLCSEKLKETQSNSFNKEKLSTSMLHEDDSGKCMVEMIISNCTEKIKCMQQKKNPDQKNFLQKFSIDMETPCHKHDSEKRKLNMLLQIMNSLLFESISEISKEHRFVPSSW
ncbi:hypothetical protein ACKWTF_012716 [Chironomus riparius]